MVPPDWPFDILSGSSSGSAKRLRTEALGDEFAEFEVYAREASLRKSPIANLVPLLAFLLRLIADGLDQMSV